MEQMESNMGKSAAIAKASPAELEEKYYEITELYDLAEELISTVESEFVRDPEAQYKLVENLVEEVGNAADVLSEEFIAIAEQKSRSQSKGRIEGAMRKIYTAIDSYHRQVNDNMQEAKMGFRNIADPIVKKIKRQMETIIASFIDFVDLSLDRIMHKSEVDELKQRQEKIALMIHNASQQQQGA